MLENKKNAAAGYHHSSKSVPKSHCPSYTSDAADNLHALHPARRRLLKQTSHTAKPPTHYLSLPQSLEHRRTVVRLSRGARNLPTECAPEPRQDGRTVYRSRPLSSELGTDQAVKTRFCPWLEQISPFL